MTHEEKKQIGKMRAAGMAAEIMDTDDFDETAFNERVDHITADPGETITLHFKDGRTAQWQGI